jgi:hypothetical protein
MKGKYLYCVTKELEPKNFSATGIDGVPIYTINWQELSCVVSDTDLADKELNKESAMAHEKVLEDVMKYSPIVPIAFGHIAKSEDEIKQKLIETHQNKLKENLNYLEGKIELSLKAFWFDLVPVLRNISENSDEIKRIKSKRGLTRDDQMRAGEIAAKLLGKKREGMEEDLATFFDDITIEFKECNLFGEQMITSLAFLINESDLMEFDKKMNLYEEKLSDNNVKLKYTGPVPPYNFVDLKINLNPKP